MEERKFWDHHYRLSVSGGADALEVSKGRGTDWSRVVMVTNDRDNGAIDIRSQEMAEALHFMLGQMLGKR